MTVYFDKTKTKAGNYIKVVIWIDNVMDHNLRFVTFESI